MEGWPLDTRWWGEVWHHPQPRQAAPRAPPSTAPELAQPRGCSDTQRPCGEVRARRPPLRALGPASRGSRWWLGAGTPRRGRALQRLPAGHFPFPSPVSSPALAGAPGDPALLQEGRGGAQQRRWAVTPSGFTSGSRSGGDGEYLARGSGGTRRQARSSARNPRDVTRPTPSSVFHAPGFRHAVPPPQLPLLPRSRRPRRGCRPPERP